MADELVLYTNPQSRGRIARWMLEEVGQPYKVEVMDYASTMKGPAYLAINPMGKVPALRHGDAVVTETAAICAYLADAFPQAHLAPAHGSKERAPYYRWLFFASGPVEAAISNKALGFVVPPERERMIGYGTLAQALNALEAAVSKSDYIAGDSFTAVDLYVGSHIGFGMMFGTLEKRPAFEKYWQRVSSRPACKRAKDLDDAKAA
jgi:glutathione S-transferase